LKYFFTCIVRLKKINKKENAKLSKKIKKTEKNLLLTHDFQKKNWKSDSDRVSVWQMDIMRLGISRRKTGK